MEGVEFGAALKNTNTELVRSPFPIAQLALVSGKSPCLGSENRTDKGCASKNRARTAPDPAALVNTSGVPKPQAQPGWR